jgi:hypothetical protein
MSGLVPNRLLFDFELPLQYRAIDPAGGRPRPWEDQHRLPQLCRIDGQAPFGTVWAAWSEAGIALAVHVAGKKRPLHCNPAEFWKSDHLRICLDTRDARDNKRATRYCHQFYFMPTGGGRRGDEPTGASHRFQRAREDAPDVDSKRLRVTATLQPGGYRLEAMIPADGLNGYDPAEHPRIGFYYMLEDRELGQQYLTVGDDLLWYVDPSTWAVAVLARP